MRLEQLLEERLSSVESNKVRKLAERSAQGALSSAATLFSPRPPSQKETEDMVELLRQFSTGDMPLENIARELATLKIEVQAINRQAILLHGERILKAQQLLKKYNEGAFTHWLKETYGNRQTPYNFLFFYQLFSILEKELQEQLDGMPKAVAYTLAARDAPLHEKKEFIKTSAFCSRSELLGQINQRFPLKEGDKRGSSKSHSLFSALAAAQKLLSTCLHALSQKEVIEASKLIEQLRVTIKQQKDKRD